MPSYLRKIKKIASILAASKISNVNRNHISYYCINILLVFLYILLENNFSCNKYYYKNEYSNN